MQIKSGVITVPVERDGREVGSFSFNPESTAFRERVYELLNDFEVKQKALIEKTERLDTEKDYEEMIVVEKEVYAWMTDKIDEIFGGGTSATVFGDDVNLFMLCQFFEEITPHINAAGGEKIKKYAGSRQQRRGNSKVMK